MGTALIFLLGGCAGSLYGYYRGHLRGWHEGYIKAELDRLDRERRHNGCKLRYGSEAECGCSEMSDCVILE